MCLEDRKDQRDEFSVSLLRGEREWGNERERGKEGEGKGRMRERGRITKEGEGGKKGKGEKGEEGRRQKEGRREKEGKRENEEEVQSAQLYRACSLTLWTCRSVQERDMKSIELRLPKMSYELYTICATWYTLHATSHMAYRLYCGKWGGSCSHISHKSNILIYYCRASWALLELRAS